MNIKRLCSLLSICAFSLMAIVAFRSNSHEEAIVLAAGRSTPAPKQFDQQAALTKLRERIKGRELEPASEVFKNIQAMKSVPAGRLLAIMQMGFARSLGVDCTHCHIPDKWESDEKPEKQIARDMSAMAAKINGELLKNIKNLKSESPTINCTTCHRGQVKPALNLPPQIPNS